MRSVRLLVFGIIMTSLCFSVEAQPFTDEVTGAGNKYIVYTPPGYSGASSFPVILYLHGAGSISNSTTTLKSLYGIPRNITKVDWPGMNDFVVVAPLLEPDGGSVNAQDWPILLIDDVLADFEANYTGIDQNRFYITGISSGAKGTWDYALAHPNKFAALVSISGNAPVTSICDLDGMGVWGIHGAADGTVQPYAISSGRYGTGLLIPEFNDCSPSYAGRLSMLDAIGHATELWEGIYGRSGIKIIEWFLSFDLSDTDNKSPFIEHSKDINIVPGNPLYLFATAFDVDGTVSSLNWTQTSGTSITFTTLGDTLLRWEDPQLGSYEFTVEAEDDDGAISIASITINVVASASTEVTGLSWFLDDGTNMGDLSDGQLIDQAALNSPNGVRIQAKSDVLPRSVEFSLDLNQSFRIEGFSSPQSIFSEGPAGYIDMTDGVHLITARPFSGTLGAGTEGISFQRLIVVGSNSPLPVGLADIAVKEHKDGVDLQWKTAWEKDVAYFSVERSFDGAHFQTIGSVDAHNNQTGASYSFLDRDVVKEAYYRLKSVDIDDTFEYSSVVHFVSSERSKIWFSPQVIDKGATLKLYIKSIDTVELYSLQGKKVGDINTSSISELIISQPSGMYLLMAKSSLDGRRFYGRLIIR